jgi:hypothetical protein
MNIDADCFEGADLRLPRLIIGTALPLPWGEGWGERVRPIVKL